MQTCELTPAAKHIVQSDYWDLRDELWAYDKSALFILEEALAHLESLPTGNRFRNLKIVSIRLRIAKIKRGAA